MVDHASDFVYGHPVKAINSQETLDAKHVYERKAKEYGVIVNAYHADNLHFNSNKFTSDCVSAGQRLTFCGVGGHHQNGIVERKKSSTHRGCADCPPTRSEEMAQSDKTNHLAICIVECYRQT